VGYFFEYLIDVLNAFYSLVICHVGPFPVEACTGRMFCDDVFASDGVGGIGTPVEDFGGWDACFLLDCTMLVSYMSRVIV
jgi:hypothetical protein